MTRPGLPEFKRWCPMKTVDPEFLRQRLETIGAGLKEAVRREVARLRARGLPVYVAKNGSVVALPPQASEDSSSDK